MDHSHCAFVEPVPVASAYEVVRYENSWCVPGPRKSEEFPTSLFVIVQEAELLQRLHCRQHRAENLKHFHMGWAGSSDPAGIPDPPCRTEGL
jgi:hypothetical protein